MTGPDDNSETLVTYENFSEAARLAKLLATNHQTDISVSASLSGFDVRVPRWVRRYVESTDWWRSLSHDGGYDDDDAARYIWEQEQRNASDNR